MMVGGTPTEVRRLERFAARISLGLAVVATAGAVFAVLLALVGGAWAPATC